MPQGHAIVIGAGIAGLAAAGAAARHFDRVTVLDRDTLENGGADGSGDWRKGVPQSRHVHVLLHRGEQVLDRFFPGLPAMLEEGGAVSADMGGDVAWHYGGGWKLRFASGLHMHCQSRGFLERCVRTRLAGLPGVELRGRTEVSGLVFEDARVVGVDTTDGERIAGDLVIEAGGRGSRIDAALQGAGFGAVDVSEVRVDVGYASRFYRLPERDRGWKVLLVHPRMPETRCGVLVPTEGGRWLATLVGWFGDHPPGDEAGFLDWAESLPVPDLGRVLRAEGEAAGPIVLHKFPANRRRRFERMARFPEGLAITGDAVCSFNPIYAQGMTAGTMGAFALDAVLARRGAGPGFARAFRTELARALDAPWGFSTAEDLRSPTATGERPVWLPLLHWYTRHVHEATWRDPVAARAFLEVMHLVRKPGSLFTPDIMRRVLTGRARAA